MYKEIYCWNDDKSIGNWGKYANGYKKAALILIDEYQKSTDPTLYNLLSYPILFIYRHFTELLLKEILFITQY